jgi:hypothetical protein
MELDNIKQAIANVFKRLDIAFVKVVINRTLFG